MNKQLKTTIKIWNVIVTKLNKQKHKSYKICLFNINAITRIRPEVFSLRPI